RACHVPIARDGVFGDLQDTSDLFVVQTAKVTHFHNLAPPRIHFGETLECFVEAYEFAARIRSDGCDFFQRDLLGTAAALRIRMTTRVVDQDTPHNLCGDGEEVRTIGPVDILLIYETNVSFVDECGGL